MDATGPSSASAHSANEGLMETEDTDAVNATAEKEAAERALACYAEDINKLGALLSLSRAGGMDLREGGPNQRPTKAHAMATGADSPSPSVEIEPLLEFLGRISRTIRLLLSPTAMTVFTRIQKSEQPCDFTIDDFPLGFNVSDPVIRRVATVLKMLHLFDFRELQNDLNALVELGQSYTANPRTNSKLGKVGR